MTTPIKDLESHIIPIQQKEKKEERKTTAQSHSHSQPPPAFPIFLLGSLFWALMSSREYALATQLTDMGLRGASSPRLEEAREMEEAQSAPKRKSRAVSRSRGASAGRSRRSRSRGGSPRVGDAPRSRRGRTVARSRDGVATGHVVGGTRGRSTGSARSKRSRSGGRARSRGASEAGSVGAPRAVSRSPARSLSRSSARSRSPHGTIPRIRTSHLEAALRATTAEADELRRTNALLTRSLALLTGEFASVVARAEVEGLRPGSLPYYTAIVEEGEPIGMIIAMDDSKRCLVSGLKEGSAAAEEGKIAVGDELLACNKKLLIHHTTLRGVSKDIRDSKRPLRLLLRRNS